MVQWLAVGVGSNAGAAGQEINLLAEQNKEKYSGQICETPIDYLRAKQQQEDKITLYPCQTGPCLA